MILPWCASARKWDASFQKENRLSAGTVFDISGTCKRGFQAKYELDSLRTEDTLHPRLRGMYIEKLELWLDRCLPRFRRLNRAGDSRLIPRDHQPKLRGIKLDLAWHHSQT